MEKMEDLISRCIVQFGWIEGFGSLENLDSPKSED
jgi:hypothetical protein